MAEKTDRRSFLGKSLLGAVGIGAACSLEEKTLLAALQDGTVPSDQSDPNAKPKADVATETMPCGKIGAVSVSRLLLGGNLIGGWSHSRDLRYVSKLFKAYNTEAKIFETLEVALQHGVNTIAIDPGDWAPVVDFNQQQGKKMQTLVSFRFNADKTKLRDHIKGLVDKGATLLYMQGEDSDGITMSGKMDSLGDALNMVKAEGLSVGVGSHSLETPIACEKDKLPVDFYVKTFHLDRYWSATPQENRQEWCWYKGMNSEHEKFNDNMWCLDSEKTAGFMATVEKPWLAFKVMAAGAIPPHVGFSHAFRNGADFVIAGMFDFQIEDDVKIAVENVRKFDNRKRPWYA